MKEEEVSKHQAEYIRHLNTLSTGSILLTVSFLEKILKNPEWKILVVVSLMGFLISIISAMISYSIDVVYPGDLADDVPDWLQNIINISIVIAWVTFLVGISCLAIFAIKNLL